MTKNFLQQVATPTKCSWLLPVMLMVLALCVGPSVVHAASFNVGCDDVAGLVAAINTANGNSEADTITLAANCTYTLTVVDNDTFGFNGLPAITSGITIEGAGATIERDGVAPDFRIFYVAADGDLLLTDLTIRNGSVLVFPDDIGGGILNNGIVELIDSTVSGNNASFGGGISNRTESTTTLIDSNVSSNSAQFGGAGIHNNSGQVVLINTAVSSNNSASSVGGGVANNQNGTLSITDSIISGNSATSGGGLSNSLGKVMLINSTVSNNIAVTGGGGISNSQRGEVTLTDSIVSGNSVINQDGGGISNGGAGSKVTLTNTTISGNSAHRGGGIFNFLSGEVTLTDSTVSGNSGSDQDGGGISNTGAGSAGPASKVTLTNTTISGNSARRGGGIANAGEGSIAMLVNSTVSGNRSNDLDGGGISNLFDGEVTVINSTISENSASFGGIGINSESGILSLINTIIADQASGSDCGGDSVTSNGHNLDSDGSCNLNATGDLTADPKLGPLQDNGGRTQTHALLAGSPAIDAGDNVACPPTDQRGVTRPQGAACDIGAYEFGPPPTRKVDIDIKPGNKRNTINPRAEGSIWVAVLSDTNPASPFDPSSQVDVPKVEFGPDGAKAIRHKVKDINKDGLGDLLLRFEIPQTGIACGDTDATLTGETFAGEPITGSDSVRTVNCKAPKETIPISYFYSFSSQSGTTDLALGEVFTIYNETGGCGPVFRDIAQCEADNAGRVRAINHDCLSGSEPGTFGSFVSEGCSQAEEFGFMVECCILPISD